MNMKKNWIALGAALMLGLTGCGKQAPVNAEQAGMLASAATGSDKFAGVVVSENAVEITRDTDKQIEELYVSVGDTVRVNEKLFEYDTDTLSLAIDKQELEMDKLEQESSFNSVVLFSFQTYIHVISYNPIITLS